jgi:hypothetical protein
MVIFFLYLLFYKNTALILSGSYVPNTEMKAEEDFGSDEGKANQIMNYSVRKHEIPTNTQYSGFIFNM